jgi:acetolactate synthase regulatory subunit
MGFGLPAAIGAQIARPDKTVFALVGDGGFQMSIPELATVANYQLPIKIVVMNNGHLGMVRQWQELFHQNRLCHVELDTFPDAELLAKAYGLRGLTHDNPKSMAQVLEDVVSTKGPCLLNVHVASYENVYPMVPSGAGIQEMVLGPEYDRSEKAMAPNPAVAMKQDNEATPLAQMSLAVLIENATGALQRILTIITAQCCVINSFAATPAGAPAQLCVTLSLEGDARALERVALRIRKLVDVLETPELGQNEAAPKTEARGARADLFQHVPKRLAPRSELLDFPSAQQCQEPAAGRESEPACAGQPRAPLLLVKPKAC